jgi:hypothetical protein
MISPDYLINAFPLPWEEKNYWRKKRTPGFPASKCGKQSLSGFGCYDKKIAGRA